MRAHQFILIWITIYDIATVLDLAFYRAAQKNNFFSGLIGTTARNIRKVQFISVK